jgi:hypothetical protein
MSIFIKEMREIFLNQFPGRISKIHSRDEYFKIKRVNQNTFDGHHEITQKKFDHCIETHFENENHRLEGTSFYNKISGIIPCHLVKHKCSTRITYDIFPKNFLKLIKTLDVVEV